VLHAAATGECYRSGDRDRLPEFRGETKASYAKWGRWTRTPQWRQIGADDDAVVLYTSGTTARHKV
jgi:acyl-CoA synthetase (AMP-forming)/AMP-acid ligase II